MRAWVLLIAWSVACATTSRSSEPRVPVIDLVELETRVAHDGILYIAAYVSLADFTEFAQSRPDLSVEQKTAVRSRGATVFEAFRDPAPFIAATEAVPDWVLASSGAYVAADGTRIFLGVGSVSLNNGAPDALAENLARAELSAMLQRVWDSISPPSDIANRPSWIAEVPMQVGLDE